jgi:hypothetical protein
MYSKTSNKIKVKDTLNHIEEDIASISVSNGGVYIAKDLYINNGGIRIGNTAFQFPGTLKYSDGLFYGYNGSQWIFDTSVETSLNVSDIYTSDITAFNVYANNIYSTDITTNTINTNILTIQSDIIYSGTIVFTSITASDIIVSDVTAYNTTSTNIVAENIYTTQLDIETGSITDAQITTLVADTIEVNTITVNSDVTIHGNIVGDLIVSSDLTCSDIVAGSLVTTDLVADSITTSDLQSTTVKFNSLVVTDILNVKTIDVNTITINSDLVLTDDLEFKSLIATDIITTDVTTYNLIVSDTIDAVQLYGGSFGSNINFLGTINSSDIYFNSASGSNVYANDCFINTITAVNNFNVDDLIVNTDITYEGSFNTTSIIFTDVIVSDLTTYNLFVTNIGSTSNRVNDIYVNTIGGVSDYVRDVYCENVYYDAISAESVGGTKIVVASDVAEVSSINVNNVIVTSDLTYNETLYYSLLNVDELSTSDLTTYNLSITNLNNSGDFGGSNNLTCNSDLEVGNLIVSDTLTIQNNYTISINNSMPLSFTRAWANFTIYNSDSSNVVINASGNISSITGEYVETVGQGYFDIIFTTTFTNNMPSENYAIMYTLLNNDKDYYIIPFQNGAISDPTVSYFNSKIQRSVSAGFDLSDPLTIFIKVVC